MKITCNRRDDILKRKQEYESDRAKRQAKYDEEYKAWRDEERGRGQSLEKAVIRAIGSTTLDLTIDVGNSFGTGYRIRISDEDNKFDESLYNVDQIHYIVGPHTVYNGVLNYINPKTNEPVSTLCMFKHYVGPLIDLINKNPQAKQFAYMSDRRYAINAYDMLYKPNKIYCQNITPIEHHTKTYQGDLTHTKDDTIIIEPFRFETLYLYKLDYNTFINNMSNFGSKENKVLIIGNQVAPDKPAKRLSRYERINFFKKDLKSPCIIGKWTNKEIVDEWSQELKDNFYPNGLDELDYDNKCKNTRYSLILFNVNDGPEHFKDNWITVKYWESVYNGCLTFVEYYEHKNLFIPATANKIIS